MEGIYTKILKQAYYLTRGFRFFWLCGLFLVWLLFFRAVLMVINSGAYLEVAGLEQINADISGGMITPEGGGNLWIGGVSLIFILIGVIYYFRSKASLITAVKKLQTKPDIVKKEVYEESEPHTITLLKLGFSLGALILVLSATLLAPIVYLYSNNLTGRALTLGLFALIIYAPLFIILYYSSIFAPILVVVHKMSIGDSLKACFDLVRKHWPVLLGFSLIMLIIEVGGIVLSTILVAISILPFVLLIQIFYDVIGQTGVQVLEGLAGIAAFMVFLLSLAVLAAFQRVSWTIAFFEIFRPIKTKEVAETVAAPEAIT